MSEAESGSGKRRLTLVPTPVGNLGDMTQRAIEVLAAADVIAAEDTRRSRTLLDRFGITTPLERLDAHTMESRAQGLLERHHHVAYVTDAGTPGISDPGAELVRLALELGHEVEVLPGATAFVPALVESGLPTARFTFEGFLPRKGASRRRRIEAIASSGATSILYESANRLVATLAELARASGEERPASVSRELSKLHHETRRGSLGELLGSFRAAPARGEVVVVVGPAPEVEEDVDGPATLATRLAGAGVRGRLLREALSALGVPRNEAYRLALDHPETAADEPG